ncbi:MAG TPA: tetratricopeptide repeat protein, partial [Gemmataceae bacterium]|nr:tetratricopeptide repeat protein [Gemmataceae bacterium]
HANRGWALLQQSQHEEAFQHFREALRLDPQFSMARQGLVASLKTRYRAYRFLLGFFLWMSRLSPADQWALVGGGVAANVLLLILTREDALPLLRPLIWPVLLAFLGFGILTWLADPLFSLCLRLDSSARLALSPNQVAASNGVGVCLLAGLLAGLAWLLTRSPAALAGAVSLGLLALPVAGAFGCPPGWRRNIMAGYIAGLTAAGLCGVGVMALRGELQGGVHAGLGFFLIMLSCFGSFLSGWLTIILIALRRGR